MIYRIAILTITEDHRDVSVKAGGKDALCVAIRGILADMRQSSVGKGWDATHTVVDVEDEAGVSVLSADELYELSCGNG